MMKKTCIKLLALCCMAALVLPSVGGFTKAGFDAAAVTAENAISFEASYAVGSTVTLPAQILTEGGKSYPAAPVVIAPSGVTLRVSELTLNETGKYVVDYRAACDGQMLSKSYSFQSVGKLFSVGAAKSAAAYGNAMYGDYVVPRPGIVASIARKDSFRYNKIINLRELGTNPFIELFVTPETIGLSDAANVFVTLTDAYDPTNAVTFTLKKGEAAEAGAAWGEVTTYVTGNAADQVPTGLEMYKPTGTFELDGIFYLLHKGNVWGANVRFALPGTPNYLSVAQPNKNKEDVHLQTIALSMDIDTHYLYATSGQIITNLSNSDIYGKNLWQGFTTGEVYLSVMGDKYNAETLNVVVTSVGGEAVTEAEFAANAFADTDPPVITLDYAGTLSGQTPNAVVGQPYKLFPASGFDSYSGTVAVKARVYRNFGAAGQIEADVRSGAFTPSAAGEYVAEYTAADRSGNVAVKSVTITAEPGNAAVLTISTGITQALSVNAGQELTIPQPVLTNGRGEARWSAEAVLKSDPAVRYAFPDDTRTIRPGYTGAYDVVYSYSDYVFAKTQTLALDVTVTQTPVILDSPVFPKYVLKGCTMDYPTVTGYVYDSGKPVEVTADVYVKEDGGAEQKLSRPKFNTSAGVSLEIIYRITNGFSSAQLSSGLMKAVDTGYGADYRMKDYFYTDAFSSVSTKDYLRYTALPDKLQPGDVASMEFVNKLQVFDFSLRLAAKEPNFDKIEVILTDAIDGSIQVKLGYRAQGTRVYFAINDGPEFEATGAVFNDFNSPLILTYQNASHTVSPIGTSALSREVITDLAGNDFRGFTSNAVYLTVRLLGVSQTKAASLDILNLNGQKLSSLPMDIVEPSLSAESASGDKRYGQYYTIPAVYSADVLDPAATYSMEVLCPDGTHAVTVDGVTLAKGVNPAVDHTILFDKYGQYRVIYTAKDNVNDEVIFEYILKTVDMTPPIVSILSPVLTGTVGSPVEIAKIRVVDETSSDPADFNVFASVRTPAGNMYTLVDTSDSPYAYGKTFTPGVPGIYVITYTVQDGNGNTTFASYSVDVR